MSRHTPIVRAVGALIIAGALAACASTSAEPASRTSSTPPAARTSSTPPSATSASVPIAPAAVAARTGIVVLRPVTSQGMPAAGYTVFKGPVEAVQKCLASRYSTEPGVYGCSPSSNNAIACLPSTGNTLLCLFAIDSHLLVRVSPTDALPTIPVRADPVPLGVHLTSGARCSALYNGTNPSVGNAFAVYRCTGNLGIFTESFAHPFDTSTARWTAQMYNADGSGAERRGSVETAYYVGGNG